MTYTKDNIIGKTFKHGQTLYINKAIVGDAVVMACAVDSAGREFKYDLQYSLQCFNNGMWVIQENKLDEIVKDFPIY